MNLALQEKVNYILLDQMWSHIYTAEGKLNSKDVLGASSEIYTAWGICNALNAIRENNLFYFPQEMIFKNHMNYLEKTLDKVTEATVALANKIDMNNRILNSFLNKE